MNLFRDKRRWVVFAILLVVLLFFLRPGVQQLRNRIASSISLALGRPVEISSVSLRFLPRPGFELENVIIHDDPGFSAEPILRSQDVTAALRLRSLFRGRLEIARLSLTEPSINLVRNDTGHWNLENLVERASRNPVAPTSKAQSEARPGFPYIEADNARINFKSGQEKRPYALTEADFSVWQESEDSWGMRLSARPLRTDFNLSDTGTIRVNGSWQRAASLRETPLQFNFRWEQGQLGQLTKLAYGSDKGWRGTVLLTTTLRGTPADLKLAVSASIDDFRRYDIVGGDSLTLAAQCSGNFSSLNHLISQIDCVAPIGTGGMKVDGSVEGLLPPRTYDLKLTVDQVPAQALVAIASHAKKNLPDDLQAMGNLDGTVALRRTKKSTVFQGNGQLQKVRLRSEIAKADFSIDRIPVTLEAKQDNPKNAQSGVASSGPNLKFGPFNLALSKMAPATIQGRISKAGYQFQIQGDAQIQRLLGLARTVGIPAPGLTAEGPSKVNLQTSAAWTGFQPPAVTGHVQLRDVRAEIRGVNAPLEIASASVTLQPDAVKADSIIASIDGTTWRGSVAVPRPCPTPDDCVVAFNLHATELATDRISRLLGPGNTKRPWYRFLTPAKARTPYLSVLRASGKLAVDLLTIKRVAATHASARVEVESGLLTISNLNCSVLGGSHEGDVRADFRKDPPTWDFSGKFDRVALENVAALMHDGWVTGKADATYHLRTSGLSTAEMLASGVGDLKIEARDGSFPHIELISATPLRMQSMSSHFVLRSGKLEIENGKLESPDGIYEMSGTATLTQYLDLKLTRSGGRTFVVSGTVTQPHVEPAVAETQAELKP